MLHFVTYVLKHDNLSQFQEYVKQYLVNKEQEIQPFTIIGLHTCGNLAWMVLDLFLQSKDAAAVIDIGCCYHAYIDGNCLYG